MPAPDRRRNFLRRIRVFILLVEIVVLEGDLAQTNTFSPLNDRVLDLVEFFLRERGGRTHLFSA